LNHISTHSFAQSIAREGTQSLKYDGRLDTFGISDVMPMQLADVDFAVPKAITKALQTRGNYKVFGYSIPTESLYKALIDLLLAMQNEDKRFASRHTKMLNQTVSQMTTEQVPSETQLAAQYKKHSTQRVFKAASFNHLNALLTNTHWNPLKYPYAAL